MKSFNDTKLEGGEGEVNLDVFHPRQILIESYNGDKRILTLFLNKLLAIMKR